MPVLLLRLHFPAALEVQSLLTVPNTLLTIFTLDCFTLPDQTSLDCFTLPD